MKKISFEKPVCLFQEYFTKQILQWDFSQVVNNHQNKAAAFCAHFPAENP